VGRKKIRL